MKSTVSAALLALGLAVNPALADDPSDSARQQPHQAHKAHKARMQEQFGVTDEQFAQMREIRRNGGSRDDAASVLTPEQRDSMREWREANPEKAREMKQRRAKQREQREAQ